MEPPKGLDPDFLPVDRVVYSGDRLSGSVAEVVVIFKQPGVLGGSGLFENISGAAVAVWERWRGIPKWTWLVPAQSGGGYRNVRWLHPVWLMTSKLWESWLKQWGLSLEDAKQSLGNIFSPPVGWTLAGEMEKRQERRREVIARVFPDGTQGWVSALDPR